MVKYKLDKRSAVTATNLPPNEDEPIYSITKEYIGLLEDENDEDEEGDTDDTYEHLEVRETGVLSE